MTVGPSFQSLTNRAAYQVEQFQVCHPAAWMQVHGSRRSTDTDSLTPAQLQHRPTFIPFTSLPAAG